MNEKNIFQKIIDGEIPSTKVYEDAQFLAFLDIDPKSLGHTLLIPKEPVVWMQEASDQLISSIFIQTKKIMLAIKAGIGCDYVEVRVVGEEVPHFHIHIIPRHHGENLSSMRKSYKDPEQMDEYAKKIKQYLA